MKAITALIIMDGFGYTDQAEGNAILAAGTPNLDRYMARFPHTRIGASGLNVGLPQGQMGNSEVGHLNIGAGRIVYQELTRITKAIEDGDFFQKEEFIWAMDALRQTGGRLHLMGLVSDGGVHSDQRHLYALMEMAKARGVRETLVHAFLDGRDVPPNSGKGYLEELEGEIARQGYGRIATVMGRYWAMDRDNLWDRVQLAYEAIANGKGEPAASAAEAIDRAYAREEWDEFVKPAVIGESAVKPGDSVIFFNFRPDRARQLTRAFTEPDFDGFQRDYRPLQFVTMTQYDATFGHVRVAFKPQTLNNTLGEYLSKLGKTQLRIAETQKYAHVTFFFNGGVEEPNPGEDRVLIPSSKVATFDLKPEMSAYEVADEAVARIRSGKYDVMILNFANCDMVGHTGVLEAAVQAVRAVDECVGRVVDAILEQGGKAIITADHGNAEQMIDYETGMPYTAHTVFNPVPFILADEDNRGVALREDGRLADLAPTLLDMMGIPQPEEMTGKSMIVH